jgi:hypothetical protein
MALYCESGAIADLTPWVPIPLTDRGKRIWPLEPERDRCRVCGKLAWQHSTGARS